MTAANKVRLYDLAKELKIDTKRLIEEVRREGVDVSVPSNSVSTILADKIRDKYFPKKDTAVKRGIRVVKKAARPVVEEAPPAEAAEVAPPAAAEPAPAPAEEIAAKPATTVRKLAARAEKPLPAEAAPTEDAPVEAETAAAEDGSPALAESVPAPSRQVRVMRPTAAALNAGIRHGERAPAPAPSPAVPTARERARDRSTRTRVEYTGTPGETATPQTTYIPPPDAGRRRSRRGSTRGGKRGGEGKAGRFDRDFIPPPPTLTLEQRIAGRLDVPGEPGELKPVRLVEGSTVKELAEKMGIKPKEIVSLLLQRGVFATINQALDGEVASELVDFRRIEAGAASVGFTRPGMAITLNSLAQGYITDVIADLLRNEGFESAVVDLGEFRTLGHHPDGRPWRLGIRNGQAAGDGGRTIELTDMALAVSGGYGTPFEPSGRFHHIFDPHTGASANAFVEVAVIGPRATAANALSTAICVAGEQRAAALLAAYPGTQAIVTRSDGSVVTLATEGKVKVQT